MGLLQRNLPSVQQQSEQQTKQLQQQAARKPLLGATAGAAGPNSMASLPLPPPEDDGVQWTTLSTPTAQPNHTARTASASNASNAAAAAAMHAANATVGPSTTGAGPADSKLEQALLVVFFFLTLLFLIDCFGPELRRQCCGSGKSQELTKADR